MHVGYKDTSIHYKKDNIIKTQQRSTWLKKIQPQEGNAIDQH